MSGAASKELVVEESPAPKTDGSGAQRAALLSAALLARLAGIALDLQSMFPEMCNPAVRNAALRHLRAQFVRGRKAGRPKSQEVTRATEMRARGVPWGAVYRECIHGYAQLDPLERDYERQKLRHAVSARRRRQKAAALK